MQTNKDIISGMIDYKLRQITDVYGHEVENVFFHEGSSGQIFRVFHLEWRRYMAVKVPRPDRFIREEDKERFIKECDIWIMNDFHDNIATCHYVKVINSQVDNKTPFVFTDYADNCTLEEWISSKRLYEGEALEVFARILDLAIQMAWGLDYFHNRETHNNHKGYIHRDIKPSNALIWEDKMLNNLNLKITDFGTSIPKIENIDKLPAGTYKYLAPEMASLCNNITPAVDIYSWALCLLEMLTGKSDYYSWKCGYDIKTLTTIINNISTDLSKLNGIPAIIQKLIPDDLIKLILKCLKEDPSERPPKVRECAEVLKDLYKKLIGKEYPRIERIIPDTSANALNNRALSHYDINNRNKALELFDRAIAKEDHLYATYNRGLIKWRLGESDEISLIKDILKIGNNIPGEHSALLKCILGHIYLEKADYEKAYTHYKMALQLAKENDSEINKDVYWNLEQAISSFIGFNGVEGKQKFVFSGVMKAPLLYSLP